MVLPLSQLMPELSCCLGCHFYSSHLLCCTSSSLYSLGLPFQLSDLTPRSALPRLPKQQFDLGSCSLSSGGKIQDGLICQEALSQAGES